MIDNLILIANMIYKISSVGRQIGVNPRILLVDLTDKPHTHYPSLGNVFGVQVIMEQILCALVGRICQQLGIDHP